MRCWAISISIVLIMMSAFAWKSVWPGKIMVIAVHHAQYRTDILVNHLSWSDKGKVRWWLENAENLAAKYHFQLPDEFNNQHVSIWQFGAGYLPEGKEDRMCFDDMAGPDNCINKERIMSIRSEAKGELIFLMPDEQYRRTANGDVRRIMTR